MTSACGTAPISRCRLGLLPTRWFVLGTPFDRGRLIHARHRGRYVPGHISGRVEATDDGPRLADVETLFVYLWGPEIWERQTWTADWQADISECQPQVAMECPT